MGLQVTPSGLAVGPGGIKVYEQGKGTACCQCGSSGCPCNITCIGVRFQEVVRCDDVAKNTLTSPCVRTGDINNSSGENLYWLRFRGVDDDGRCVYQNCFCLSAEDGHALTYSGERAIISDETGDEIERIYIYGCTIVIRAVLDFTSMTGALKAWMQFKCTETCPTDRPETGSAACCDIPDVDHRPADFQDHNMIPIEYGSDGATDDGSRAGAIFKATFSLPECSDSGTDTFDNEWQSGDCAQFAQTTGSLGLPDVTYAYTGTWGYGGQADLAFSYGTDSDSWCDENPLDCPDPDTSNCCLLADGSYMSKNAFVDIQIFSRIEGTPPHDCGGGTEVHLDEGVPFFRCEDGTIYFRRDYSGAYQSSASYDGTVWNFYTNLGDTFFTDECQAALGDAVSSTTEVTQNDHEGFVSTTTTTYESGYTIITENRVVVRGGAC